MIPTIEISQSARDQLQEAGRLLGNALEDAGRQIGAYIESNPDLKKSLQALSQLRALDEDYPDWFVVGRAARLHYGPDNPNNRLLHIRGFVDGHVVLRWWSRGKRRWIYVIESPVWYSVNRHHLYDAGASKSTRGFDDV